jgi:peptidoglycan/xylan/chitin deacetylase (PgdA/CDA1 family)
MRSTGRLVVCGAIVAALFVAAAPGAGRADDPAPVPIDSGAAATAVGSRGAPVQQTPVPPVPSWTDPAWQSGRLTGCVPGRVVRQGDTRGQKLVTFTFDDGPDPLYTQPIMDEFERRGLTATFFLIGRNLRLFPDIGRSIVERGFAVGNHSVTHTYVPADIAREVGSANSIIESILGVRTPYFRSPGLVPGRSIDAAVARAGMCTVSAAADLGDYLLPRRSPARLCERFAESLQPGMIALLHDGGGSHASTVAALPCMLDTALDRGYSIVSLAELLNSGTP